MNVQWLTHFSLFIVMFKFVQPWNIIDCSIDLVFVTELAGMIYNFQLVFSELRRIILG
jgi:hypothetical protein